MMYFDIFLEFLLTVLKNAEVSKKIVMTYRFLRRHFFKEMSANIHAKQLLICGILSVFYIYSHPFHES